MTIKNKTLNKLFYQTAKSRFFAMTKKEIKKGTFTYEEAKRLAFSFLKTLAEEGENGK